MKSNLITLCSLAFVIFSCNDDFGKKTVTYTKAVAFYGDLDEIRATSLIGQPEELLNPGKIYISENVLLIGEEGVGIHVYDNSNPENPDYQLFLNIHGNREFYVHENHIYAESVYDMVKIDISDPFNPTTVSRVENAFAQPIMNNNGEAVIGFEYSEVTEEVDIDADVLSDLWNDFGTVYYDFENQLIPPSAVPASFAGSSNNAIGTVNRIAYSQKHVYAITRSNIAIFDDRSNFEFVSNQSIGWQMETIYPQGDRLFIGSNNSMEVYNISDPTFLSYETSFFHATSCDPVFPVDQNTAYVTLRTGDFAECPGDENALLVLDIGTEFQAIQLQEIPMASPYGMTLIGNQLFVGEGANGLKIFDATDRRNLSLDKWEKNVTAYDVIAHPTLSNLILVAGPEGFSQYQIGQSQDFELLSQIQF